MLPANYPNYRFGNDFSRPPLFQPRFPNQYLSRVGDSPNGDGAPGDGNPGGNSPDGGGGGNIRDSFGNAVTDSQGNSLSSGGVHGNSPGAGAWIPGYIDGFSPSHISTGAMIGGIPGMIAGGFGGLSGAPSIGSLSAAQGGGGDHQPYSPNSNAPVKFSPGNFSDLEAAGLYGANQAYNIYHNAPTIPYQGSGVAGFGDTSTAAHNQITDLATGNPYLAGATDRVSGIATGDNPFLQGFHGFSDRQNEFLDRSFDRGAERIQDRLNSQFGRAGRTNSGYHSKTIGDSLGDFGATLYGNAFDAQMNRDLAALSAGSNAYNQTSATQLNAAGMIPGLNDAKFDDADRLQTLGQAQDFMSQLQLDDEITRFNQEQNNPWTNLQNYMSIVNSGSPTQQPNLPAPPKSNSTAQTLGTVGLLASLFANGG